MTIEGGDFILTPISECSPVFDLDLLYVVRPKGKEAREEFKPAGYGLPIEAAIKKIAHYRVNCKHEDEAISLVTYFEEFKKELDSLKTLL